MYYPLIKVFVDIALLRAGPQHLPASVFLLILCLFGHALVGLLLGLVSLPVAGALLSALSGTVLVVALVQGLLIAARRKARFLQSATALLGAETLLGIAALPVMLWFYNSADRALPSLLSLLLLVWSLAIIAHILRQALESSMAMAMLLALGYTVFSYYIADLLIPGG